MSYTGEPMEKQTFTFTNAFMYLICHSSDILADDWELVE